MDGGKGGKIRVFVRKRWAGRRVGRRGFVAIMEFGKHEEKKERNH